MSWATEEAGGRGAAETLKVFASGVLALSAAVGAASVSLQLNSGLFSTLLLVAASFLMTVSVGVCSWAALLRVFGGRPHGAVVVLGLSLPLASWLLIHIRQEYWLLGPAVSGVSAAEASGHRSASSFRFTDARVAAEYVGVKSVRLPGLRGYPSRTEWYYVAPVVPVGWKPGQPVTLWAGAPVDRYYASLDEWSKPHGAAVQLSSYEVAYLREAAADSASRHGLTPPDGALFIRWTAEPEAEVGRARKFVLWVALGNDLLLALVFAAALLKPARPGRHGIAPPSLMGREHSGLINRRRQR